MTHELVAYLIQSDGHMVAMPTDELLCALEHVVGESRTGEHSLFFGNPAVYEFLQALKWVMQTCKSLPPAPD